METVDNPALGRFEAAIGDATAVAEYRLEGNTITFTHTWVPEEHRGRGIGAAVVRAALDSARQKKLSVVPRCSFVAKFIRDNPEYRSLLEKA